MKLLLSIIAAGFLSLLLFLGPVGIYIISLILAGLLIRSFWLLTEIHKQTVPVEDRIPAEKVYDEYIKDRDRQANEKNM